MLGQVDLSNRLRGAAHRRFFVCLPVLLEDMRFHHPQHMR
jgi:hypothetical protein